MTHDIFLIDSHGKLVGMSEQPYGAEADLQRLIAEHPALLAGGQINPSSPRRWLLIRQEMGVASDENHGDRWQVDHLFLDQDSIPTLVEVKRSTDPRIRREVVGQMLDYAAHAAIHWSGDVIRSRFEAGVDDADAVLADWLGDEADIEAFWQQVDVNLRARRMRLLFVADQVPPELRRIVEFLNEISDPVEVLAIEVRQFVGEGEGEGVRTIAPRLIGQTVEAEERKRPRGAGSQRRPEGRETVERLTFWEAFSARVAREHPHLQLSEPTGGGWLLVSSGVRGAQVGVKVDDNMKVLTVRAWLDADFMRANGERLQRLLEANDRNIHQEWVYRERAKGAGWLNANSPKATSLDELYDPARLIANQDWLLDTVDELLNQIFARL